MKRKLVFVLCIILFFLLVFYYFYKRSIENVECIGVIESENKNIYAPFAGKILYIPNKKGMKIKKGDILFVIDTNFLKKMINRAVSEEELAENSSEKAAKEYKKLFNLFESGEITKATLDKYNKFVNDQYKKYLSKKQKTNYLISLLKQKKFFAKDDLIISEIRAKQNSIVSKGQHILTVSNPNKVFLIGNISKKYFDIFKKAGNAKIQIKDSSGKIFFARISDVISSETKSDQIILRLEIPKTQKIYFDTIVRAKLILSTQESYGGEK